MPQIVSASGNSSIYLNGANAPFLTKHRVSEVLQVLPKEIQAIRQLRLKFKRLAISEAIATNKNGNLTNE
jgi:hypothetical protein